MRYPIHPNQNDDDPLLPPPLASERAGLSPSTLQKMRANGTGPRFIRLSATRVAYRLSAINAWLAARERQSTLEDKGRAA